MYLFQLCAPIALSLGQSQSSGGGRSCGTAMPGMAESAPHRGISRTGAFIVVRQDVYKSPSGVGPRCLSLSRGHSPALPSPTLKGTRSKGPQLGLNPMFLYKQTAQIGVGVLSAGCASLLLRHPGGPLRPALSTHGGSSRGSLGLPAPAPPALTVPGSSSCRWDLPSCFQRARRARHRLLFIKLYGETLAGSIPACLSLAAAAGEVIAVLRICPGLGTEGTCPRVPLSPLGAVTPHDPCPAASPAVACSSTPRGAAGGYTHDDILGDTGCPSRSVTSPILEPPRGNPSLQHRCNEFARLIWSLIPSPSGPSTNCFCWRGPAWGGDGDGDGGAGAAGSGCLTSCSGCFGPASLFPYS